MSINSYFTWHRWKRRCLFSAQNSGGLFFLRIEEC